MAWTKNSRKRNLSKNRYFSISVLFSIAFQVLLSITTSTSDSKRQYDSFHRISTSSYFYFQYCLSSAHYCEDHFHSWFKCCKRVNIPSVTHQRVDNFVSGKHFVTLSCLRLVKKLTGEFMRVNGLYFLIEYKILERFVCWRHERAQQEYEARSRNLIWLDKFTGYVIIHF